MILKNIMNFIKRFLVILLFVIVGIAMNATGQVNTAKKPVDYVNPYIGNISHLLRPTHAKIYLPNSYLRVNPEREDYTDVALRGLPLISKKETSLAFRLSPYQGKRDGLRPIISYTYDNEHVTPYSYSVILDHQETKIDFGVSHESAMYQLNFQGKGKPFVVLTSNEGMLQWDGQALAGYQSIGGGTKVYIYLQSDKAPKASSLRGGVRQTEGKNVTMVLQYPKETNTVTLRYGISFISTEQARKNMQRELAGKTLQQVQDEGRKIWNKALGKITVQGGNEDEKTAFYTALYRSYYRPVAVSENGRYYSGIDGQVYPDNDTTFYTDDAGWDTFRVMHPLRVLTEPEIEEDILHSYLRMAGQKPYFQMPKFISFWGSSAGMISDHIILSFLDAARKGLDVDLNQALKAGKNVVLQTTYAAVAGDSAGFLNQFYQDHGYIPALWPAEKETIPEVRSFQKRMSIATTLGTAYDEWALAQMAKETGQSKTFPQLCKRSFNYRNLWNSETGFFHPKDKNGQFIRPIDYTYSGGVHGRDYYDESNGWVYRFALQYNIPDLIHMMGGRKRFTTNLDSLFSKPFGLSRPYQLYRYHNQTGIVGHFSMGNEPDFHVPYLYDYAGQPWKTQKRVRRLTKEWFRNNIKGIPGDGDGGALSSYAVFSYMGFYPFSPGLPIYTIGSPVFNHISLALPGGGRFEIIAKNNSPDNKYIQSATLNGQPLDKPWFNHKDLKDGGQLILRMGPRPNKQWGSDPDDAPPSMPFTMDGCKNL